MHWRWRREAKAFVSVLSPLGPYLKKKNNRKEEGSFKRAVCRFCLITDLVRKIGISDLVIFVKLSNRKLGCSQWQNGTTVRRRNYRVLSSLSNASTRLFAESNTKLVVGQRPSIVKLSPCALLRRTGKSDQFCKKNSVWTIILGKTRAYQRHIYLATWWNF